MKAKRGIRFRLIRSFMFITIVSVMILDLLLIIGIKKYYYNSLADALTNKIEFSINYYNRYLSNYTLKEVVMEDIDVFWNNSSSQVQIYDANGQILLDSIGVADIEILSYDVEEAMAGRKGIWYGSVPYYDDSVMSVSMPFFENGEVVGVIRFISSLGPTNRELSRLNQTLILAGVAITAIAFLVSLILSNSIVSPIIKLTKFASKMADGQLNVRSDLQIRDEIGLLSDTLNDMADQLQKKERLKNEFISSISHELRTPLTSIKGWAITLNELKPVEEELLNDGLKIIENEADRLTKMVEELLDFSRYISGRITLNKDLVNIIALIDSVITQLSLNKSKEFEINFISDFNELYLVVDENRIKQVLINVIDNAIKFSEGNNKIDIRVTDDKSRVRIFVIDYGIGISHDDLKHIKEKFFKGSHKNSHTGLGLSIANEIIELHEGMLSIESELGTGTKVIIDLPKGEIV